MHRLSIHRLGLSVLLIGLSITSFCWSRTEKSEPSEAQPPQMKQGIAFAKRKDFERAEVVFKAMVAQDPENAAVYNNLGNVYLFQGRYGSAILQYCEALQRDPDDKNINLNLGIVYYMQMEITSDAAYVGNEKSEKPKTDWKTLSDEAFDRAFANIKSASEACFLLEIPTTDAAAYSWLQKLLVDAAKRREKPNELKIGGGRSQNQRKIRVYWKGK